MSALVKNETADVRFTPFNRGVYTLIIFLSKEAYLRIGKLGAQRFPKGYYAYTGSALGTGASSLSHRVSRHLRKEKPKLWHIDFLLAHENAAVTAVIAAQTNKKLECKMNRCIKQEGKAKVPVVGFGASDCRENCESHLFFYPDITKNLDLVEKVVKCARFLGDNVFVWTTKDLRKGQAFT